GERGMLWYDETRKVELNPALPLPADRIVDTSGAGDVFHGAYIYSYVTQPNRKWVEHFEFAKAAAAFKVQRLGNEAGLPSLQDVEAVAREFGSPLPQDAELRTGA